MQPPEGLPRQKPNIVPDTGIESTEGLTQQAQDRFVAARTNIEVRNALVLENQNLIYTVMRRFQDIGTLSREDLFQEGMLALMYAVDHFDVTKGFKFSTYAFNTIEGYLKTAITKNKHIVNVSAEIIHRDLTRAREIGQYARDHGIKEADSAERLGLSGKSALPVEISFNETLSSDSEEELGYLIKNREAINPENIVLARDELNNMNTVIKLINNEFASGDEREIFYARYGDNLNQPQKPVSYREIAHRLGDRITPQKVQSTLERFWRKLRPKLKNKISEASPKNIDENWFLVMLQRRRRLLEYLHVEEEI
jgi:RNA polymerase sigma factor (sigma-70 family)